MMVRDKLAVSSAGLWSTLYLERRLGNICARAVLVHTDSRGTGTTLLYEKGEYTECLAVG